MILVMYFNKIQGTDHPHEPYQGVLFGRTCYCRPPKGLFLHIECPQEEWESVMEQFREQGWLEIFRSGGPESRTFSLEHMDGMMDQVTAEEFWATETGQKLMQSTDMWTEETP